MIVEDLTAFFGDFAQTCTIAGGTVTGIFDAPYERSLGMVDSSGPVLTIRAADWPDVARGDSVTIDATEYSVLGIEPDGTGVTVLRLQRS